MTADRRVVTLGQVLQMFAFSLQQSLLHLTLMILVVDGVDGMCCERRGSGNEVKGQDEWPLAHFSATLVQNFTSDFRRHRLRARSVPFSRPDLPPRPLTTHAAAFVATSGPLQQSTSQARVNDK